MFRYQCVIVNLQDIIDWLDKKAEKYTSAEVQNELLKCMSTTVLRQVVERIQKAAFFSIMVDECVDISNREQLVLCFRYVDNAVVAHEDFVGLYECPNITANTNVSAIDDVLVRLNLSISKCRGQCYDGGSNMAGSKNGVKEQILKKEPRALFTKIQRNLTRDN